MQTNGLQHDFFVSTRARTISSGGPARGLPLMLHTGRLATIIPSDPKPP